jgi:hypothetical protein
MIAKILSPGERTQVRASVKHKSVLPFRPPKTKLVETTTPSNCAKRLECGVFTAAFNSQFSLRRSLTFPPKKAFYPIDLKNYAAHQEHRHHCAR